MVLYAACGKAFTTSSYRLSGFYVQLAYLALVLIAVISSLTSAQSLTSSINTSSCGTTKTCWRQPDTCSTGTCTFLLTWANDGNGQSVSFEMEGTVSAQNSWVSFGLSYDQQMGSDSVIDCVYNSATSAIVVQSSWNSGHSNQLLSNPQIVIVSGSTSTGYVNGQIVCQFKRLISNGGSSLVYPLDSSTYNILMATGPASNGVKQQHTSTVSSTSQYNFTSSVYNVSSSSSSNSLNKNLIKAHGIMMIMAWMVFASFGMLMPRYCKSAWSDSTWCGNKIWFQIHQPSMIITLLLTAAAFIMIFVEADGYVSDLPSPCLAHPPLGICVMALVLINPIMAIFRCKPDDRRRKFFNIFHFIVGLLAHLSAVVTIFLGLYVPQLDLPMWTKGVMGAYICFHVLIELILAIHMHRKTLNRKKSAEPQNDIAMKTVGAVGAGSRKSKKEPDSESTFTTVVLSVHLCGVLGFAIAISVQIGLTPSG